MGGLLILLAFTISTLLWAKLDNIYIWILLFIAVSFGIIGLFDDWIKVSKMNSNGLKSYQKVIKKETLSQHQHEQSTRREQTDQIRESSRAGFLVDLPLTTHVLCIIKRAPGRLSGLRPGLRGVSLSLNWTFPGASCHTLSEPIPQWLLFLISGLFLAVLWFCELWAFSGCQSNTFSGFILSAFKTGFSSYSATSCYKQRGAPSLDGAPSQHPCPLLPLLGSFMNCRRLHGHFINDCKISISKIWIWKDVTLKIYLLALACIFPTFGNWISPTMTSRSSPIPFGG